MTRRSVVRPLCIVALALACRRVPAEAGSVRTVRDFEAQLTRRLTPELARRTFGAPDEETGSGLRIYIYTLDGGSRLWLGFPGDAPIVYAKLMAPDGSARDLLLLP